MKTALHVIAYWLAQSAPYAVAIFLGVASKVCL